MRITLRRVAAIAVSVLLVAGLVSWAAAASDEPFNVKDCEANCRWTYGGSEWSPPPLKSSQTHGYNNCILACQREYWKRFDKETEGSGK